MRSPDGDERLTPAVHSLGGDRATMARSRGGPVRDIVEQAMRGDREAFGTLVLQHGDRMYAIATRILRDSQLAEDALQGALVTAWRQLPTLRDPDRFEA